MTPQNAARIPATGSADPERPAEVLCEQRVGVGADGVEGDVAEIEQAGEADHDIQAPSEHHISQHQDAEIEQIAIVIKKNRDQQCENQESRGGETSERTEPSLPTLRNAQANPDWPVAENKRAKKAAEEHECDDLREEIETRRYHQRAGRSRVGIKAQQEQEQAEGDERRDDGAFGRGQEFRRAERRIRSRGFQTFSTSGRPRMPVGRKISTTMRIEKAATSL